MQKLSDHSSDDLPENEENVSTPGEFLMLSKSLDVGDYVLVEFQTKSKKTFVV